MKLAAALVLAAALADPAAAATATIDVTGAALDRCLNAADNASTAGQTDCEAAARVSYDRRMNAAYAALLRRLPASAQAKLRASQRQWIVFRDSEYAAQAALFATRQGTLYVPMQAHAAMALTRDRALALEGYLRVMAVGS